MQFGWQYWHIYTKEKVSMNSRSGESIYYIFTIHVLSQYYHRDWILGDYSKCLTKCREIWHSKYEQ